MESTRSWVLFKTKTYMLTRLHVQWLLIFASGPWMVILTIRPMEKISPFEPRADRQSRVRTYAYDVVLDMLKRQNSLPDGHFCWYPPIADSRANKPLTTERWRGVGKTGWLCGGLNVPISPKKMSNQVKSSVQSAFLAGNLLFWVNIPGDGAMNWTGKVRCGELPALFQPVTDSWVQFTRYSLSQHL